jgi:DNA invertase Pin-like site-specific DNA recombinase
MDICAIYVRLSDEDRNKLNPSSDSESIQNQKNMLMRYAIEHEWDVYKIYSDDDFSGLDSDRPDWNKMIKDAESNKFNIILCKSQSRFTRDMEAVEKYLHTKFLEWNIRFIGLTDNADTANKGNKKARQINGLVNEWYCEDISENIRAAFDIKRNQGQFIGSFATYGYLKDPKNKNKIIIDEEAAKIVQKIYNWYINGHGTQHIAYMLNEEGIPNPTKYKHDNGLAYKKIIPTKNFGLWNKTTVKRILKNEMYIGTMVQGVREKVSYKSKKFNTIPKEKWIKVKNTHIPIIDLQLFYEVQRRISKHQKSTGLGQAHIFATKVRCMDCKNNMIKVTAFRGHNKAYPYLRCKIYATSGNNSLCTSHSIRLDILQETIANKLRKYILESLDEDSIIKKRNMETSVKNRIKSLQLELSNIENKIQKSVFVLKNLYLDKVNGNITNDEFNNLKKEFTYEQESLIKQKGKIETDIEILKNQTQNEDKNIEIFRKYKDFQELTHEIVNKFISYIEIGEKNEKKEQEVFVKWLI